MSPVSTVDIPADVVDRARTAWAKALCEAQLGADIDYIAIGMRAAIEVAYHAGIAKNAPTVGVSGRIRLADTGTAMYAYDNTTSELLGAARRTCVGGSRGRSWYWDIWVGGKQMEDARRKGQARYDLIRYANQAVGA